MELNMFLILRSLMLQINTLSINSRECVLQSRLMSFSPPKSILTDQGNEFNNQLVTALLNFTGIKHEVTAGYNPRTNSKCERAEVTVADCLRKHGEKNPNRWDEWIPTVMLAYNSKVHATTQMTPFEIIFGRKMHAFENWKTKTPMPELAALEERCKQISLMNNVIQPKAVEATRKQQIIQKKNRIAIIVFQQNQ